MSNYSQVYQLEAEYRAALLRLERGASSQLVEVYGRAWQQIQVRLRSLLQQIALAQANGTKLPLSWLLERNRLQQITQVITEEITHFSNYASATVYNEQMTALNLGRANSLELMRAALPGDLSIRFNHIPTEAVISLVGHLQNGSPLKTLFDKLAPDGVTKATDVLVNGLLAGNGARQIGADFAKAVGTSLDHALTIARSETMRAYTGASMANYQANSDVVEMWEWSADDSPRTCQECLDMNGKQFPVSQPFEALHPNDRCCPLPITASADKLAQFAA